MTSLWLTLLWLLHHVRFPPPPLQFFFFFKRHIHFLCKKIFHRTQKEKKREKKRGLILSQHSPTPTGWLGSLTPDKRMAWGKRSRGAKMWKGSAFSYCVSPQCLQSVWKISSLWSSCSQWGLAPGAGRSKRGGQGSPRALNRTGVLPSSQEGQTTPAAASHNTGLFTHTPSFPSSSSPSSLVHLLFFSPFGEGAVIHNPLNYQRLNYPSRSPIFSPPMEIQKQLTSSRLGTFPRKGHAGNWMTPAFTFLTMTSLLHA